MKDLTLKSDDYNNLKFNMQKLILDIPENDVKHLSQVFAIPENECQSFLNSFAESVKKIAEDIKQEINLPIIKNTHRLAFLGDSISSDRESYVNVIRLLFHSNEHLTVIDGAISGYKSDDVIMKLWEKILSHKPDIAHVLIGTNDLRRNDHPLGITCLSLSDIERNINYILKTLGEFHVKTVLSTISPIRLEGVRKRFPNDNWAYDLSEIDRVNTIIAKQADLNGAKLNDMRPIYAQFDPKDILFEDGLHLNQKGQTLLTKSVLSALSEYLEA